MKLKIKPDIHHVLSSKHTLNILYNNQSHKIASSLATDTPCEISSSVPPESLEWVYLYVQ